MTKLHSLLQKYRPRWDLVKGTHGEVPLQTNSKIVDKTKSPGADNSFHDFPQLEFTTLDDAARIVGCWKARSKQGLVDAPLADTQGMQRAVAFCQIIDPKPNAKSHKVSSKNIADMFEGVADLDCALWMNTDFARGEGLKYWDCGFEWVAAEHTGETNFSSFQDRPPISFRTVPRFPPFSHGWKEIEFTRTDVREAAR